MSLYSLAGGIIHHSTALLLSVAAGWISDSSPENRFAFPEMLLVKPPSGTPFHIAKLPTTWKQYMEAVRAGKCTMPVNGLGKPIPSTDHRIDDDYPVTGVTAMQAKCYASWLSEVSHQRFRLPSEAEWLAAAVGAPPMIEHWGQEEYFRQPQAVFDDPRNAVRGGTVRRVGQGSPSASGAFDMEGNGGEMTVARRPSPSRICVKYGPDFCDEVEVMGLSYSGAAYDYRNAKWMLAALPQIDVGFRVAGP